MWSNAGAKPGDVLVLTKPLGTGIVSTALKFNRAPADVVDAAMRSMTTLNRAASDALLSLPASVVHGCTDITGFGLVGHACEMAAASGCTLEIDSAKVPLLPGVRPLVAGNVPGGGRTNTEHFGAQVRFADAVDPELVQLLHDPQTSGGLLVAVSSSAADQAVAALERVGVTAARIGRAVPPSGPRLLVS